MNSVVDKVDFSTRENARFIESLKNIKPETQEEYDDKAWEDAINFSKDRTLIVIDYPA